MAETNRVKIDDRLDRSGLRAALDAAGYEKVSLAEDVAGLWLEVPEGVDALAVSRLAHGVLRRALAQACRDARTLPELKAATADALDLLFG